MKRVVRLFPETQTERPVAKILIVEDDKPAAEMVVHWLEAERHNVDHASTGEDGMSICSCDSKTSFCSTGICQQIGYDVLKEFRAKGHTTPVLMLTGKSHIQDKEMDWMRRRRYLPSHTR